MHLNHNFKWNQIYVQRVQWFLSHLLVHQPDKHWLEKVPHWQLDKHWDWQQKGCIAAQRFFLIKGVVSGGTVGFIDIKDTHEICHDFLLISDTWLYMINHNTIQKNTWKITHLFFVKTGPLWSVSKVHHVWVSCIDVDCTQSRHLFTFSEPNL